MDVPAPAGASPTLNRVVFGVYRDGDNNLDAVQERNVTDFVHETRQDRALKVVAEDTTGVPHAPFRRGDVRTEWSVIEGGKQHVVRIQSGRDMSSRGTLAALCVSGGAHDENKIAALNHALHPFRPPFRG